MNYRSPTTAMDHQRRALLASAAKPPGHSDAFGYLMDMGTGKSKVILDEYGEGAVSGGPRDLLVIAPAGSYKNWFRDKGPGHPCEINVHMDPEFRERLVDVDWHSGPNKGHQERIRAMLAVKDKKRPRALFVNVESLSTVTKAIELCKEFVAQRGAYVAIDESTTIKGDSKRTDTVLEIGALAQVRRIASGLWTPRAPLDLYNQCQFLEPKILRIGSSFAFKRRYAHMVRQDFGGRKFWQVTGWHNIEDLQEKVAPWTFRVLKSECLDLQPKNYTTRGVELTKDQRRMYDEIKLFGHAQITDGGGFVTTDSVIKQIMRLHQINCGFVTEDPMSEEGGRVIRDVPENRTDTLVSVLSEHDGKAIIWAPFRRSIDKIVARLTEEYGPRSCAQWHGGNKGTRGEEEIRFLNDPECRYMVATQAAGMRGNTWVVADLVVYYANNYDLEQRDQSEDRAHRKGQTRRVTYVDLIAENTVDAKMVKNLRAKITMASLINGEEYREWLV